MIAQPTARSEQVDDPGAERRLGSDDRQIDGLVDRESDQSLEVVCGDGDVFTDLRSARVSRRDEHAVDER